jgi:hypothetical protein
MKPILLLLALSAVSDSVAAPWTYQGSLSDGGEPANGRYDLRLTLLNEASNARVSGPLTLHGVEVRDGQFSVEVDFGFDLETAPVLAIQTEVQQNNAGFAALGAPKRFDAKAVLAGVCWDTEGNSGTDPNINFIGTLDAQPLVFRTRNAQSLRIEPGTNTSGGVPTTASIIAGASNNQVLFGAAGATISGGGVTSDAGGNLVADNFGTVSGGRGNRAGDSDGNVQNSMYAVVGGGLNNRAEGYGASVGGGLENRAANIGASVGGGRFNSATGDYSVVGGGRDNLSIEEATVVSGGRNNYAAGRYSAVGGGFNNAASNANGAVGGGANNTATGNSAFVGGGASNSATGSLSSVSGGVFNCAGGANSWAGGTQAKVRPGTGSGAPGFACEGIASSGTVGDAGSFVWADSQQTNFVTSGTNQFLVRAFGGAVITGSSATNSPEGNRLRVDGTLRVDALGSAGSTSLCRNASNQIASCSSSARYKQEITDLDLGLAAVSALRPVAYRWKSSGAADVGFVAEEVAALDERLIVRNDSGEVEGVRYDRLSAVLAGAVQELAAREAFAQQERDAFAAHLVRLEQRLKRLER